MVPVSAVIPELSKYSEQELSILAGQSTGFARYLRIIQMPVKDPRILRHQAWLRSVAATALQRASTADICRFWSDTADACLQQAWSECGLASESAVLFALGKLGAQELNLSSDVDLIVVATPEAQATVERKIRKFRAAVGDVTELGFCFRLDFDLRPGGRSGPLITTPSHFQDHYWSRGETWEKIALVRLRPVAGSSDLTQSISDLARRFSYRKFLDFSLLDDLKQVRSRIHLEGFDPRPQQVHLKLQRGGIRDIELFVNALQVLHGGKITRLQTVSTEATFQNIRQLKIIPTNDIEFLHATYWDFRRWENLTQALDDRQEHFIYWPSPWQVESWPSSEVVAEKMARVDTIVSKLLGDATIATETVLPTEAEQIEWLRQKGFDDRSITEVWPSVVTASTFPHRTDRDENVRRAFLLHLVGELEKTPNDRDLALSLWLDLLRAVRAKTAFFTLLNREPRLIRDLARLFSFSPYLGALFASRPDLIDGFVLNVNEPFAADFETMLDEMAERKFLAEVMASIAFLDDLNTPRMMEALTLTAEDVALHLLDRLAAEMKSQPMDILCLGKWGGRELGLKSDLDFIFLCANTPTEKEQKVAKRFISRLTDPYRGGSLYEIDLRLRPSGKAGPILTTPEHLNVYLKNEAEVWERQAYLRARCLKAESIIDMQAMLARGVSSEELTKLSEIRGKLLKPRSEGKVDIKQAPGGLVDIEFAVQTSVLVNKSNRYSPNTLECIELQTDNAWKTIAAPLMKNYAWLRTLEQLLTLAGSLKSSEFTPEHQAVQRAAKHFGIEVPALEKQLNETLDQNMELLGKTDPRR